MMHRSRQHFKIASIEQVFGLLFMNPDVFQLRDEER